MLDKAKKLLSDFKDKGWKTEELYERLFELTNDSDSLYAFAEEFLTTFNKGATIFNDSLSYLKREQFEKLIGIALSILQKGENDNAESVIAYASLQFPDLLHPHLETIFELKPNESTYYAEYSWRKLEKSKIKIWKEKLENSQTSIEEKRKLFSCLLETRDLETIEQVYRYALSNNLFVRKDLEEYLIGYLETVGFTKRENKVQSYCPNRLWHFFFPKNYLPKSEAVHLSKEQHPTWRLEPNETKFKIGGIIRNDDLNPFFHLITFEEIPAGLNLTNFNKLVLGLHIRELNECGELFYQHDQEGNPQKINTNEEREIEYWEDDAIVEALISFSKTPERWRFQDWGLSNSRENLFRLGGEPTWIQSANVLNCPTCKEKMDFLMQLDSELPDVRTNYSVMFGSGGICYVFWCDKDKVSGYLMQCT